MAHSTHTPKGGYMTRHMVSFFSGGKTFINLIGNTLRFGYYETRQPQGFYNRKKKTWTQHIALSHPVTFSI